MMRKLRVIVKRKEGNVNGLTIPPEISIMFQNTYFHVEKSGCCIVAYSGTSNIPTKQQVKDYQFTNVRI